MSALIWQTTVRRDARTNRRQEQVNGNDRLLASNGSAATNLETADWLRPVVSSVDAKARRIIVVPHGRSVAKLRTAIDAAG